MSDDAKLALRVLAGMKHRNRTYRALVARLSERFPVAPDEQDSRKARAIRAINEALADGCLALRSDGRVQPLREFEGEMGGG